MVMGPIEVGVLAVALFIDLVVGEPPRRFHPVVWMGGLIALGERIAPNGAGGQLLAGFLITSLTASLFAGAVALILNWAKAFLGVWCYLAVAGLCLKPAFALRELLDAARLVGEHLIGSRTEEARVALRALVSRDTRNLGDADMYAATIQSLAENINDSFVAPTFYFLLAGVPGAFIYRAVNTADAMLGYRGGRYEYLGKFAARADDILNLIPARLTGLLIVLAAPLGGWAAGGAWRIMWRDHRLTPSPNGGWPMNAMAGALQVRLCKPGVYSLGAGGKVPDASLLDAALQVTRAAAFLWIGILGAAAVIGMLKYVIREGQDFWIF